MILDEAIQENLEALGPIERIANKIATKTVNYLHDREMHPVTLLFRESQEEAVAYIKERMPEALLLSGLRAASSRGAAHPAAMNADRPHDWVSRRKRFPRFV